jgi:hypothetical protein
MNEKDMSGFDRRQIKIDKKSVLTECTVRNMYDILKINEQKLYSYDFLTLKIISPNWDFVI